jgi:thymidylate synthase
MADPVITTYLRPQERVLFNELRDANPIFHLVEALWMLASLSDVEFLLPFNSTYGRYAEPDGNIHGAYGRRWRTHFGVDQIWGVIAALRRDPTTRQAVMAMWDPAADLNADVKDRPCNTTIYFDGRQGRLNMTVW